VMPITSKTVQMAFKRQGPEVEILLQDISRFQQ
jgi:hypothetical protein